MKNHYIKYTILISELNILINRLNSSGLISEKISKVLSSKDGYYELFSFIVNNSDILEILDKTNELNDENLNRLYDIVAEEFNKFFEER